MALVSRIIRLFKADFHSMLDQLEEPEAILNQAIREMQDEIAKNEHGEKLLSTQIELLNKQLDGLQETIDELDGRIDICFQQKQESLAKSLVRKKLESSLCLNTGRQKKQNLSSQKAEIEEKLTDQKQTLTSIIDQKRILTECSANRPVDDSPSSWQIGQPSFRVSDAEIEAAFLQEKSRRETGNTPPQL